MSRARDADIQDIYPLSPTQQGLLFHSLLEPDNGAYVVQVAFTLEGELDRDAFEAAWRSVQARHDVLRTAFAWERLERPLQVVGRTAVLPIERLDFSGLDDGARKQALDDWVQSDRERGFDPRRAPLMRLALLRLAPSTTRIVWTYHHLLLDGWSLPLLLREWVMLYREHAGGAPAALPPARPYRDFIVWLQERDSTEALAFWRDQLSGFEVPTPLAFGAPEPEEQRACASVAATLSRGQTDRLKAMARSRRVTLSTLIQSAWALLLHRYSGLQDLVFGLARSGRPADLGGIDERIGLYLNLLPMRVTVDPEQSLADGWAAIQACQLTQQPHEFVALREVQRVSGLAANVPLFESIIVFENYPSAPQDRFADAPVALSELSVSEQTNYPVSLYAAAADQLELRLLHAPSRLSAASARRLLDRLARLLELFAQNPDQRIGELTLTSPAEFDAVHVEANRTRRAHHYAPVSTLLEEYARRQPETPALACDGRQLSYAELDAEVGRVAARLLSAGVRSGDRVGVCLHRGMRLPVAMLAILRTGCAYVPLDPSHPVDRIRHVVEDASLAAIVLDERSAGSLPAEVPVKVDLDAPATASVGHGRVVSEHVDEGAPAYLIYTSGSTGRAKGVTISHGSLNNLLASMAERIEFGPQSRLLAVTTVAFDIATMELLLPIASGACLILADDEASRDPQRLMRLLDRERIDVMQATPATWRLLLAAGWSGKADLTALSGGEALEGALARSLLPRVGRLWNLYGPTETTIWSAALPVTRALASGADLPIGRPLDNTVLHVLDPRGRALPPGMPGELHIGGMGLSSGYHGQPALTAERFVDNPLPARAGLPLAPKLYRTGDQVRQREDGLFEFIGRYDQQVKLRGFRIELGEIESTLRDDSRVEHAVAELIAGGREDARLVAAVRLAPADEHSDAVAVADALRRLLSRALPVYMVPADLRVLPVLPMTPNGKLDRAAVRRLFERPPSAAASIAPDTPVERTLMLIWEELLGQAPTSAHDNFFEVGGHSLLAVRAQGLMRERLEVDLALLDIFRYPTLASLSAHVESLQDGARDDDRPESMGPDRRASRAAGAARRNAQRARRRRTPASAESSG
ncbi:MAG: amino acid adenylation domain-containing protein [Pseudomonadota bacterium]